MRGFSKLPVILIMTAIACREPDPTAPAVRLQPSVALSRASAVSLTDQITSGSVHACGLTAGGDAYCWGWNRSGQIGDGTLIDRSAPVPVQGGFKFSKIQAGNEHTCALTLQTSTDPGGKTYCWGMNSSGQLGNGGLVNSSLPLPVPQGNARVSDIAARGNFTCAISSVDKAFCWGENTFGQLGDGSTTNRLTPVPVSGGLTFGRIAVGFEHTCALRRPPVGTAYCWGSNAVGQLGNGTTTSSTVPVAVTGGPFKAISLGYVSTGREHTCALDPLGRAFCWGSNIYGELGNGGTTDATLPGPVTGSLLFESMIVGLGHSCAVTASGQGFCWGFNYWGQLGIGTASFDFSPNPTPLLIPGIAFRIIAGGNDYTCAVATLGLRYCWGVNDRGQLGNNGAHFYSPAPYAVVPF